MKNKHYPISVIALITFSLTTALLFVALRDPVGLRSRGATTELMTTLVLVNFAFLVASTVYFIYQSAHKERPSRIRAELLESFAERATYEAAQIPEAITIQHEDLIRLSDPLVPVRIKAQDRLVPERVTVGQMVKLTSPVEPKQYVVVEVIDIDESSVALRRTGF